MKYETGMYGGKFMPLHNWTKLNKERNKENE